MNRKLFVSALILARRIPRWVLYVLATLLLFFYFVQYSRLPPNSVDGALILGYLEEISRGGLPYWDFIDVYGPLNWVFPTLFYSWAGREVWGVRIWVLILKLLSAGMTYKLVSKLANRFYAILAVCWMTVLLGQPWQFMQTPYACHTALPLLLWAWYLVLSPPVGTRTISLILAGGITAVVLWIKVSTGLFLFAGGLFCCFYWIPASDPGSGTGAERPTHSRSFHKCFRLAQVLGLVAYAAVFGIFVREYFDFMYFLYLGAPLLITLVWTLCEIVRRWRAEAAFGHHLRYWLTYLTATTSGWLLFFLGYYGWQAGWDCLAQVTDILVTVDYMDPFPPLGVEGHYIGFNEYYWLQLPWLVSLLFCTWLALRHRRKTSVTAAGDESEPRFQTTGLWALTIFNMFVVYPRSDEAHVIQAVIPAVPALFVLLYQVERLAIRRRLVPFRGGVALAVVLLASTIAVTPSFKVFRLDEGDWFGDRLRYLRFRRPTNPAVRNTSAEITDYHWDMAINYTALRIKGLVDRDSEVLVFTNNELINYHSHTKPVGGRYRYLFYLLKNDLLNRSTFEAMVPPDMVQRLLDNPPRVIVDDVEEPPLVRHYPEFGELVKSRYTLVEKFAHIHVYLRDDLSDGDGEGDSPHSE